MSTVAAVLHWPLPDLCALDPGELMDWHGHAVRLWNQMQGAEGKEG